MHSSMHMWMSSVLNVTEIGCFIGGISNQNICYDNNMVLIVPFSNGLKILIGICEQYSKSHIMIYNETKYVVMVARFKKPIGHTSFTMRHKQSRGSGAGTGFDKSRNWLFKHANTKNGCVDNLHKRNKLFSQLIHFILLFCSLLFSTFFFKSYILFLTPLLFISLLLFDVNICFFFFLLYSLL